MFTTPDSRLHASMRKPIAPAYTAAHLVQLEPFVDHCVSLLKKRFFEFSESQEYIDIGHWMQLFSLDAIGEISFGERFGCIETGKDPGNIIAVLESFLIYAGRVGVYPKLHPFLFRAKALLFPSTKNLSYVHDFGVAVVEARLDKVLSDDGISAMDTVSKLLAAHQANPERVTKDDVFASGFTNIVAGSDTTSISLAAVIYQLWRHPRVLERLRGELKGVSDPITYAEAMRIPYLEAVIKEALRVHPAAGLPIQRIVPKDGRAIAGRFFPAGTIVGINAWAAHSNRQVFGEDADVFNPDRWLGDPEIVKKRDAYFMTFGAGSRTCIGKHITHLEMIKLIPELVTNFDFEPETTEDWKTINVWFIKPIGWRCRIKALKKGH
ncbi:pisatin demethylase [Venturia nashicola]|uniref:Pisatin demethylase n=1 Tax=Venturia nashicola TaxID=86259 RepID=A0A4Z1NT85_9PEZI|nr:pisatin demethylase [Venturia nashicola]TLD19989.1 pisatin demethylase [Venturia nashicola]